MDGGEGQWSDPRLRERVFLGNRAREDQLGWKLRSELCGQSPLAHLQDQSGRQRQHQPGLRGLAGRGRRAGR